MVRKYPRIVQQVPFCILRREIVLIEYYPRFFGNIILEFKKNGKMYKYIVDRDEIYLNKEMICNNSYICEEGKSPCQKLIEIIISTAN